MPFRQVHIIFGHLLSQAKYFDVMEFYNVDIFRISFEFLNIFFHELFAPSTVIGLASVCNDGPNGYKEGLVKGPFDYYVG
jgi:hypothetical protein